MIILAPIKDKNAVERLFSENGIAYNENSGCVSCMSGDELMGYSLYELDDEKITVKLIEAYGDISLADGILRSTLHVAAERSILNAFYDETVPISLLQKLSFIKDEDKHTLDIDKLFKSCCGCS